MRKIKEILRLLCHQWAAFVAFLARPLRDNLLFMLIMGAVWGVTVWREVQYDGEVLIHSAELLVDLYLVAVLLTLLPQKVARVLRLLLYIIGYLLAVFEVFLTERFLMLYTPTTLRLWMETTGEETKEFFKAYLQGDALWHTLLFFIPILLLNVLIAYASRRLKCRMPSVLRTILHTLFSLLLMTCLFPWTEQKGKMLSFFQQQTSQTAETVRWQTFYTPFYRLIYSKRMLYLADRALVDLKRNMKDVQIDTCTYRCPQIVLVIGESYNKYHSQLYGYKRPTTPKQLQMARDGDLAVYTNVVSTWNLTSNVFKNMLSTHSIEQPGTWCDGVLFPSVFRKAGYKVAFLTNQYQNVKRQSGVDFNGSFFLNDPGMDTLCFDFRNRMIYRYDKAFIQEYTKYKPAEHNLVIFHLYGQHQKYDYRFTKKDAYFTADSMKNRKNLARWMKQMLADYDNSTRYNDEVFSRICKYFQKEDAIVLYLSDHGEEVFDHSLMFGRTPADPLIPLVAHYEFEVPMVMWFSPVMQERHPALVNQAKRAIHRPFMTDDLPHLLMGLAGIGSPYYDVRRDLLHDSFNVARKRLLKGYCDYDSLLKKTRFERERIKAASAIETRQ